VAAVVEDGISTMVVVAEEAAAGGGPSDMYVNT
jgi:hypothetical protein